MKFSDLGKQCNGDLDIACPKTFPLPETAYCNAIHAEEKDRLILAANRRIEHEEREKSQREELFLDPTHDELVEELCSLGLHEGGHAVLAFHLGWTLEFVSVLPAAFGEPFNRYQIAESDDFWHRLPLSLRQKYLETEISMRAGGFASECVFRTGSAARHVSQRASVDFSESLDCAAELIFLRGQISPRCIETCTALKRILKSAVGVALSIVHENRSATLELACSIIEHRELSGEQICSILERHRVRKSTPWSNLATQASDAQQASLA